MTVNRTDCRADVVSVENILSEAYARLATDEKGTPMHPITPYKAKKMDKVTAILQVVEWTTEKGIYGSETLVKDVKHETLACPDCEAVGRHDERGDIVCSDGCGRILNENPLMLPEDHFNDRTSGGTSGGGKPALNPANNQHGTSEPDVQ